MTLLSLLGIVVDDLDREEAARFIMTRDVSFRWAPQIVEMAATARDPGGEQ